MSTKRILTEVSEDLFVEKDTLKFLKEEGNKMIRLLQQELKKEKIAAEVFVGGSYAKGTFVRGDFYDIDIFIRFDWRYEDLSSILDKVLKKVSKKNKLKLEKIHGSRDYFRILLGRDVIFEIIPVVKIKKPREARNVTDLSYSHVRYVRTKLRKNNLAREIILAKQFCKAQKSYGAESYIMGFSGYALECLVIYYGSFEKMLKALAKVKVGERLIIDQAKLYKKKDEVLFEMNEGKLGSPIILVDPTWKERNAMAALSRETFEKFQDSARKFLKKPSKEFFIIKKFDVEALKKKAKRTKGEFLHIKLKTGKQPGDIAGTKLKKFSNYLSKEISRYFNLEDREFNYGGENAADLYLIAKSKKEIMVG